MEDQLTVNQIITAIGAILIALANFLAIIISAKKSRDLLEYKMTGLNTSIQKIGEKQDHHSEKLAEHHARIMVVESKLKSFN